MSEQPQQRYAGKERPCFVVDLPHTSQQVALGAMDMHLQVAQLCRVYEE